MGDKSPGRLYLSRWSKEEGMSNKVREISVRDALASLVVGRTDVETPSGFIDVLSDTSRRGPF